MSLQNIGVANRDDAFYRYKMPKMITKIEGRGNGIKTNLVNMVDIAKALGRPASYTTKYFGCELGAQSKFDAKTGVSLVNGAHDTQKLAGLLENFIKKYVQCYECGNPETDVIITKSQMINLRCAACGFVSDVDMRDKLTTFILKNPPEPKKDSKDKKAMRRAEKERLQEGKMADEEQKRKKKEAKKGRSKVGDSAVEEQRKIKKGSVNAKGALKTSGVKKKTSSSDEEHSSPPLSQAGDNDIVEDDDDNVQWQADTSVEAARQRIQEQLTSVTADMVMLSTNKRDLEEKEPRQLDKEGFTNNGTKHSNEQDGYNDLIMEIKDILQEGCAPGQMVSSLGSLVGSPQEIMTALFEALFEGVSKGFAKEVAEKKGYLSAVATDETSQSLLLHAMEAFCSKSGAVKEVALVAKVLYDADVLEEETILQWYNQGLAGCNKDVAIWKNVKPFVEWLQSAESESEEE